MEKLKGGWQTIHLPSFPSNILDHTFSNQSMNLLIHHTLAAYLILQIAFNHFGVIHPGSGFLLSTAFNISVCIRAAGNTERALTVSMAP